MCVAPIPLLDRIKFGIDNEVYALIVAYRLAVKRPDDLRGLLQVAYFREGLGVPPNAPNYASGFSVQEVLDGEAGWSGDDIEDFRSWLQSDAAVNALLRETFDAIEDAIQKSLVWSAELVTDEPECGTKN